MGPFFFLFLVISHEAVLLAADTGQVYIVATVITRGNCKFLNLPVTINIGTLDPASGLDVTGSGTVIIRCNAPAGVPFVTYGITDDDGLWESGPGRPRLRHTTLNEFIPYSLNYPPSGTMPRNSQRDITVSVTVLYNDYKNASVGNYTDTVTLTIMP